MYIDDMQFGFSSDRGTTDIFLLKHLQEKCSR